MDAADYPFEGVWTSGENIAVQSERGPDGIADDIIQLHEALMNSPGHRANILNPNFTEIGIGIERGDFRGFDAIMVTQNFASTGGDTSGTVEPVLVPTPVPVPVPVPEPTPVPESEPTPAPTPVAEKPPKGGSTSPGWCGAYVVDDIETDVFSFVTFDDTATDTGAAFEGIEMPSDWTSLIHTPKTGADGTSHDPAFILENVEWDQPVVIEDWF